jgi:hypothetical protein
MHEAALLNVDSGGLQHKAVLLTCAESIPLASLFPFHIVAGAQGVSYRGRECF